MKRRTVLALGGVALSGGLGGCLGGNRDGPAGSDDTTPSAQFQYDARNSGVAGAAAPETTAVRWRTRLSPIDGGLAVGDDRVVVATGGELVALDAESGETLWTADVGHDTHAPPAVTADTAYVTTWNGGSGQDRGVVAVAVEDGSERWRAIPDVDVTSAPTVADDTVYVGGSLHSDDVIALDATDGGERWRVDAGQYATTPAVADGTVYVGGGSRPVAYALDAESGETVWRFETNDRVWGGPTVVDDAVYVGSGGGRVYAIDADDGSERWRVGVGSDVRASVAATRDAVYVPARESLAALGTDGTERWSVDIEGGQFAPTVAEGSVVAADRHAAFGLDADDGSRRWHHEGTERSISDMVFAGIGCEPVVADGVAYVGSHGGDVHALEDAG